jgi:hypothetical protein
MMKSFVLGLVGVLALTSVASAQGQQEVLAAHNLMLSRWDAMNQSTVNASSARMSINNGFELMYARMLEGFDNMQYQQSLYALDQQLDSLILGHAFLLGRLVGTRPYNFGAWDAGYPLLVDNEGNTEYGECVVHKNRADTAVTQSLNTGLYALAVQICNESGAHFDAMKAVYDNRQAGYTSIESQVNALLQQEAAAYDDWAAYNGGGSGGSSGGY